MTNVLDIARGRIDALKTEISHLEAFIRMGEKLSEDAAPVDVTAAFAGAAQDRADPRQA